MPAHVEILNPEKLNLTNFELNEIGNRLVQRLHDYDAITKKAINDNSLLLNKLKEVAPQLFKEKKSDPKVNISINPDKEKKKKQ